MLNQDVTWLLLILTIAGLVVSSQINRSKGRRGRHQGHVLTVQKFQIDAFCEQGSQRPSVLLVALASLAFSNPQRRSQSVASFGLSGKPLYTVTAVLSGNVDNNVKQVVRHGWRGTERADFGPDDGPNKTGHRGPPARLGGASLK